MAKRRSKVPLFFCVLLLGCGGKDEPPDAAPTFGFDTFIAVPDITVEVASDPEDGGDAVEKDVQQPTNVTAVLAQAATATVAIAEKIALQIEVMREIDDAVVSGPPDAKELPTFQVDGQPLALGATIVEAGPQPAVSIWKGLESGKLKFWIAGARPGDAKVVVLVAGVASEPIAVHVTYPTALGVRMTLPTGQGATPALRVADAPETIQVKGATIGKGGLTVTLRFPASAKPGDSFNFEKTPASGSVQVKATVADLGEQPVNLLKGRIWIDQVDKGLFRGTFLGTEANLSPVAGVFILERDGKFGIDVLDEAQVIETSTKPAPTTGIHASRATLSAIGGGRALLTYRHIKDASQATLVRVLIDAKTGSLDKSWPPLVTQVPTCEVIDNECNPLPGVGYSTSAMSAGKLLTTWEGRSGKDPFGQTAPNQVWYRIIGNDGELLGDAATVVATDDCSGQCRPQVVALPSSRWLIVWSAPGGQGIRSRRVNGNLTFADDDVVQIVQAPATGVSVAVLEANVALAWSLPNDHPQFRLFLAGATGLNANQQEQTLGLGALGSRTPQIVALAPPVASFLAAFSTTGSGGKPVACAEDGKCPGGGVCNGKVCSNGAQFRRIDLKAAKLGSGDIDLAANVDRLVAVSGKLGQVAALERVPPIEKTPQQLRLRKLNVTGAADPGSQLGGEIVLSAASKSVLQPALCYVPEADVYVLAWSGDATSDGVWIQRFR